MDASAGDAIGEGILIRYDGLDADHHEIEVGDRRSTEPGP